MKDNIKTITHWMFCPFKREDTSDSFCLGESCMAFREYRNMFWCAHLVPKEYNVLGMHRFKNNEDKNNEY